MSYWPAGMKTDPLGEWPGARTARPTVSPFSAKIGTTIAELGRETRAINAKNVRLQIDLAPEKFRQDGNPRADAVPRTPAIILTFETKLGPQSYPCDSFTRWEDNLRAIVLTLEAFRKVDRYGVTKNGAQYRGFLAIEGATAMPAGFGSVDEATRFIAKLIDDSGWTTGNLTVNLRQAKRLTHPDVGGDADLFQRVNLAEQYLKQNGAL
ncbi:hypothetical protein MN032_10905 [Agromyces atrinae]|uniref:hypothetical protein n=1 Tax=Agromyces atrinae TaxID=592376 RepID=UPI001F58CA99|nr:hypothetical protein [Agromyces atrinae]MCI2958206.1 hypothetical protein [Agromyces atrinae]